MSDNPHDRITYIGKTNHRNAGILFGIRERDRRSHFYIVGKTGTGKSHLIRNMITQDIAAGRCRALFDPHRGLRASGRERLPPERAGDLLLPRFPDPGPPLRFKTLAGGKEGKRALAASRIRW